MQKRDTLKAKHFYTHLPGQYRQMSCDELLAPFSLFGRFSSPMCGCLWESAIVWIFKKTGLSEVAHNASLVKGPVRPCLHWQTVPPSPMWLEKPLADQISECHTLARKSNDLRCIEVNIHY